MSDSLSAPFQLQPFQVTLATAGLTLSGQVHLQEQQLALKYLLAGDMSAVIIPAPQAAPQRRDNLWQHTCFEFFLGYLDSPGYWEFNLSPSGDWNVYRFTDYRQGLERESRLANLPFEVKQTPDRLDVCLELDLSVISPAEVSPILGVTTVIEHSDHEISYWALNHLGEQADFHRRDSFILDLRG